MKIVLILVLAFGGQAHAEIHIGGGVQPAKTVKFVDGMTLLDALADASSLACSDVYVVRRGSWMKVDLPSRLRDFHDGFALKDGDLVSGPEHVMGCIGRSEGKAILDSIIDYRKIRNGSMEKPVDWDKRIDALRTHRKKTEPNHAMERSRILVTDRAITRSAPSIRLTHLGR